MVYQTLLGQGSRIPQDVGVVGYDNMVGIGDLFPDHLSHSYMGQGDEHYHDIPAVGAGAYPRG